MFVDEAEIEVESGKGGDGCVSFRREKFVPRGGPDGGDGGRGGNVIFVADENLSTLLDFRHLKRFKAGNGEPGKGKRQYGKQGEDCVVRVPVGTIVEDRDENARVADLAEIGQTMVIAFGGRGGKGNFHFRSATNRTPRKAQKGKPAEAFRLRLTLKLLADVGLVGLPNAGKSTFLARISKARPKIADYPFTTLSPNLGIVSVGDWKSMVVADIPGIVEGAHAGKGLGHQFLRHIERTRVLAILIDSTAEEPEAVYETLLRELAAFSDALMKKPRLLVYSKADLVGEGGGPEPVGGLECHRMSSITGDGVPDVIHRLYEMVRRSEAAEVADVGVPDPDPSGPAGDPA